MIHFGAMINNYFMYFVFGPEAIEINTSNQYLFKNLILSVDKKLQNKKLHILRAIKSLICTIKIHSYD